MVRATWAIIHMAGFLVMSASLRVPYQKRMFNGRFTTDVIP